MRRRDRADIAKHLLSNAETPVAGLLAPLGVAARVSGGCRLGDARRDSGPIGLRTPVDGGPKATGRRGCALRKIDGEKTYNAELERAAIEKRRSAE